MRSGGHRRGGAVAACCAAVGLALLLAACGPASGSSSGAAPGASGGGNTVTYAMQPGNHANYPFPFFTGANLSYDTVANVDFFQYLMYRPLYWFGTGVNPYLNTKLSLAEPPVYRGHRVTIRLKQNYKWSNGEPVDARDVVFWMNMMNAAAQNYAFYSPKGLPADVTNVRAASKYVVTMDITTPTFSQSWFTNNELSQITPMPMAWDVSSRTGAPGSGGCAKARFSSIETSPQPPYAPISASAKACVAVYDYLAAQALKGGASAVASSPLWSIVDGPWKLQSIDSQGKVVMTFNKQYAGAVTPGHITTFTELPYTSEQAEYNVLQDPTASQTIDVGYLPTVDAPAPAAGALVGANPSTLANYQLSAQYIWQLSYMPYNFKNTTGQGAIFDQLYFRQAFQYLVDQEGVINGPLHGYGKPTVGPIALYPPTTYLSQQVKSSGDPWSLNIKAAENKLSQHGWKVRPNGLDTCVHAGTGAGECGAHIPAGTPLKFTMMYASGIDWMQSGARELASNASLAGIKLTPVQETFDAVVGNVFGAPGYPKCMCKWQLALWGSWTYAPDYLPTGDTLFQGGALNNAGNYNDPTDNQMIDATLQATTPGEFDKAMHTWDSYVTSQLPVVYEPDQATLIEAVKGLEIGPQNSADTITPEDWHYLK
jgi:peptide/nickel transport system substrate-binding protein